MTRKLNIFRAILIIWTIIMVFSYHLVYEILTINRIAWDDDTLLFFGFYVNGNFMLDVILLAILIKQTILLLTMVK